MEVKIISNIKELLKSSGKLNVGEEVVLNSKMI
jgi:hypothetical protein